MSDLCTDIINALAAAGVDGLCVDQLDYALEAEHPSFDAVESPDVARLIGDGIVEYVGCSWLRLTRAEWERRVVAIADQYTTFSPGETSAGLASIIMAVLMPSEAS